MAGKFVVNGTQTTVTFTYTALTTKVLATVNDAVGYLYPAIFGEVLDGAGSGGCGGQVPVTPHGCKNRHGFVPDSLIDCA